MKITKKQLKRIIQEIAMGHDMMEYEAQERAQDDEFNRGYMAATEGLPSDVDTSEYPRHYMRGYDAGLEKSEWLGESTRANTLRRIRKLVREAIDIVNQDTGEVIDFGQAGSLFPDEAVPDLVKRLDLDLSPNDTLSKEDWEKLFDETVGKHYDRDQKRKAEKYAADRERLNIDNLLQRLRDWAQTAADEWQADNPQGPSVEDVAYDLADAAQYSFQRDEWEELRWHFDDDEHALRSFITDSM